MSIVARISSLARRDALTSLGLALTAAWLILVLLFWLLGPSATANRGGVAALVTAMGMVLPVVLVWLAVSISRALALLRAEAEELRARLDRLRAGLPDLPPTASGGDELPRDTGQPRNRAAGAALSPAPSSAPAPARDTTRDTARAEPSVPDEPAPAARLGANGAPRPRPAPDQRQAALRLDDPGAAPVDSVTLIRALNFPDGPDDHEAIDALRQALRDQDNSRVLRAAQDVVTLLAGRDIYMDMLPPRPASAETWRRFAEGQRGSAVAALGGIDDADSLALVAEMMRQDEIFRDTAHHFLRHFDGLLARVIPHLDDMQIAVLADSRSARAFMLLGRVAGSFG